MKIPFPSDIDEVNATDFDVLRCLYRDGPLWKMEVTRRVNDMRGGEDLLDVKASITKQAVAKRMERLHELEFLRTTIMGTDECPGSPDLDREFIIGYALRQKGRETLHRCSRYIIRDALHEAMSDGGRVHEAAGLQQHLDLYFALNGGAPDRDPVLAFVEEEALDQ